MDTHNLQAAIAVLETKIDTLLCVAEKNDEHFDRLYERVDSLEGSRQWFIGALAALSMVAGGLTFVVTIHVPRNLANTLLEDIHYESQD